MVIEFAAKPRAAPSVLSTGPMIFCTLFNSAYLTQGISLYHSLERTAKRGFVLYVLCMDDSTASALMALRFPFLKIIRLSEIEDDALKAVKASRSVGEYCWTCTTPLILNVQDRYPLGSVVTYVDADICFFSDPAGILSELGNGSIFIHEHDFAPEHLHLLSAAGRFNVGVVAFRNDADGRACLKRWQQQCLNECTQDPVAGKCGDQHYLDEWPSLYSRLVISKNVGVGLAPWNISKHRLHRKAGELSVNGCPIVFYHYHKLRLLRSRYGIRTTVTVFDSYSIATDVVRDIYQPYAIELWRAMKGLRRLGLSTERSLATLSDVSSQVHESQIVFSAFGIAIAVEHKGAIMKRLHRMVSFLATH